MLNIQEITDKQTWETFLTHEYLGSYPFFQSWLWGEVLIKLQTPIIRLGMYENKKLIGVLMVVDIQAKRGHYLYLRQGPVFLNASAENFVDVLEYVKELARERQASFIRISRLLKIEVYSEDFFAGLGFKESLLQIIDTEVCPILDISRPEDEILKTMRKSHRYLIKKALTMDIEIIKSTEHKDLQVFLALLKKLSQEKKFVVHTEIEEEFAIFTQDNACLLFLAKFEGKVIAAAFIDFIGNTAMYRHAATDPHYRHIPASYLLQWEAIREAKRQEKKLYNFMGIAPENAKKSHPWQGFTLFKTGFGGDLEYYYPTMDLPLNAKYWKNYLADWITKKRKGY